MTATVLHLTFVTRLVVSLQWHARLFPIPSQFVWFIPNIAKFKYKAEFWSFWAIHLGPILLQHCFPNDKCYQHFCLLVNIIKKCLQFTITDGELDELQEIIIEWVEKYER